MKTTDFINEGIAEDADEMHRDHEVQMARADCYNAAKYAIELHKLLHKVAETQGLDGWVSEKITLANDYLRTVHEYLTHEMAQGQQDTVIIPEFSFESANAEFDRLVNEGVAEGEKNPHTSALGKALHRDLSKEKKASPAQVKRNQERWAQRQKAKAEQPPTKGMSNAEKVDKGWRNPNIDEGTEEKDPIWNKGTPMPKDYTCPCGIHVHPSIRNPKAIHDPGCPYAKKQGVAEGAEFGAYYYEQLAQQTFDINPNLQDENEILNLGYKIAKGELGSRAQGMFRDEDFPSDFVSAYGYLKKQGVNEVSDKTLTSYLTKVDADSQKHEKDPTKRSAEKRNKSVAGFSRAFNKLDSRKEKVDEIDPNNYDSDEDYYRDLEAQDQRNGAAKRPFSPDWDADDDKFMQKWYEKHGLRESSVGGISAGAFATGPTAGGGKPGTGKPKKVGNIIKRTAPKFGKGIY